MLIRQGQDRERMEFGKRSSRSKNHDEEQFIHFLSSELPGLMSEAEMFLLFRIVGMAPQTGWVVELGTYQARATVLLCERVGDNRVVSIDNWCMQHHGPNAAKLARENLSIFNLEPHILTRDTRIVPTFVEKVAFLFVDSCHRGPHLREEINAYSSLLCNGALVALHDYGKEKYIGFTETIEELFNSVSWERVEQVDSLVVFRTTRGSSIELKDTHSHQAEDDT